MSTLRRSLWPLQGMECLDRLNLFEYCELKRDDMARLLTKASNCYHNLPYHNECHAADVCFSVTEMILNSPILNYQLSCWDSGNGWSVYPISYAIVFLPFDVFWNCVLKLYFEIVFWNCVLYDILPLRICGRFSRNLPWLRSSRSE